MPKELADRFEAVMRGRGERTAAAALRSLIEGALREAGQTPVPSVPARPSAKGRRRRLWVNVTAGEAEEMHSLAAPFGGVTAWFRGILDARMGRSTELPAREEIEALHQATVQLGRLGTNCNQIARALNTARLAGEPIDPRSAHIDNFDELKASVEDISKRANAVIFAARRRVFNE
jgi:hypothetical protein